MQFRREFNVVFGSIFHKGCLATQGACKAWDLPPAGGRLCRLPALLQASQHAQKALNAGANPA